MFRIRVPEIRGEPGHWKVYDAALVVMALVQLAGFSISIARGRAAWFFLLLPTLSIVYLCVCAIERHVAEWRRKREMGSLENDELAKLLQDIMASSPGTIVTRSVAVPQTARPPFVPPAFRKPGGGRDSNGGLH